MNIIIWLGLILASAILYRLGGQQGFNTKFRDIGVPLITTIALLKLGICHWVLILHFGLLFGALTTYWDDLFNGEDNFFMHGFMIGLACFPLMWAGIAWWIILLRAVFLGISIGLWSKHLSWDVAEEGGRGALITGSLLLFML